LQNTCHLGPRELCWDWYSRREHLTHLCPREEDVILTPVRTGLACRHLAALLAVEGMLELQGDDADLIYREFVEDLLCLVCSVVLANAGVVTANDDMCTAIVLPADGVKDRLVRASVAHWGGVRSKHHAIRREVVVDCRVVALHSYRGRDVSLFGLSDERVDEQPVHHLQGALL